MTYPVRCSDCGADVGQPCMDGCPSSDDGQERSTQIRQLVTQLEEMERDPHFHDFMPGYATEIDWMNAQEADDYREEGSWESEL